MVLFFLLILQNTVRVALNALQAHAVQPAAAPRASQQAALTATTMEIAPHALLDITNPATSATRVEVEKQVLLVPLRRVAVCLKRKVTVLVGALVVLFCCLLFVGRIFLFSFARR